MRILLFWVFFTLPLGAQQIHPALQSHETFMQEIANKKWECSFSNYPVVRFQPDKIEILANNGQILADLKNLKHLEPGVIRVVYDQADNVVVFAFAPDLQSFIVANMEEISEFDLPSANAPGLAPTSNADVPLDVKFKNHPYWEETKLYSDKMEILDGEGKVFATNTTIPYYQNVRGVILPQKQFGALILSRTKPGGWYLRGYNIAAGVRSDLSGSYRNFLGSKLSRFALRSAHFNYPLLIAGKDDLAGAQEQFAHQLAINNYGETSEEVGYAYREMGILRGYTRSYAVSPLLHQKSFEHFKKHFSDRKALLLEQGIDLAEAQNDAGQFEAAKATLSSVYGDLPPEGNDVRSRYLFFRALGTAEFGLRAYPLAGQHFNTTLKLSTGAGQKNNMMESMLAIVPCQLAQSQGEAAKATLQSCMALQDQRMAENAKTNFDTWKLAFACVALGLNEEALKYAPKTQRQNSVSYEEYGRLVSLYHSGDKNGAQQLAREFMGRFRNIAEINIRQDIDPITIKLTQAIAEPTPANIASLEQSWITQVDSLRNRPLKNYLFARVMVVTLNKLKSGR